MKLLKRLLSVLAIGFVVCLVLFGILYATGFVRVYHITSGYHYLSASEQARVIFAGDKPLALDKASQEARARGEILCVSGAQLRQALLGEEKALVYLFNDDCSSPSCLPLSAVGRYAQGIGAKVYYVATDLRSSLFQHPEPILSIDFRYYDTKWYHRFYERFCRELIAPKEAEDFSFVLFEGGRIARVYTTSDLLDSLPALPR